MGSVTIRYFCYGCLFTSVTWTTLLFVYFNFSEVTQPLKNVPIKGSGPHGPFPQKFYPRFTRGPNRVLEPQFKANKIDDVIDNQIDDPGKGNMRFSPELGMIFNERDQELRDLGYQKHAFNMLISNRLGYHRDVPDTRDAICKEKFYPSHLPVASVVICFYNEAFSALLRTVHSVIDRTPAHLLHEIILVDDDSDFGMRNRCEDSEWVTAGAAPRGGSIGGPGPHPRRDDAGMEKGPGPRRGIRGGVTLDPAQKTLKTLQISRTAQIYISFPSVTERRDEEKKEKKQQKTSYY